MHETSTQRRGKAGQTEAIVRRERLQEVIIYSFYGSGCDP